MLYEVITMQLQDTLVHNPGMSDAEKSQVQEKINNLTAEKEVLDWKDANPGTPTVESYEAQKGYYDRLWQQNVITSYSIHYTKLYDIT